MDLYPFTGGDMDWKRVVTLAVLGAAAVIGLAVIQKVKPRPKPPPIKLGVQYPIAAMYSNIRGNGDPFVRTDGTIDTLNCKEQARYDVVIIDPDKRDDAAHRNRSALRYIRALNDTATWLAYIPAGGFYVCGPGYVGQTPPPYGCDTTQFTWQMYRLAEKFHAILYNRDGSVQMAATGVAVDFAQSGFPDALAQLAVDWADGTGTFNPGGVFNDGPCLSIAGWWPGSQTDFVRQGFPTIAAWDAAYRTGVQTYYDALRVELGPTRVVVGNCGPDGPLTANGWMGENHPEQNPSTWAAWDSVLARADTAYVSTELSFITKPRPRWQTPDGKWHVAPFTDADVQRRFRFVVGSAALHDHSLGVLVGSPFDGLKGFMPDQWSDWYHAFGRPIAKAVGSRREFANGTLLVNPYTRVQLITVNDSTVSVPPMDATFVRSGQ